MTVNYTSLLSLGQPVTGTESGTWGDDVNNAITAYLDIAIAGTLTLTGDGAVTLANTQGTNTATNIGATTAQYAIIKVVGPLTTTKVITAPSTSKTYIVVNTDSVYNVTIKASGQAGATVAASTRAFVVFNGTDYVLAGGSVVSLNNITGLGTGVSTALGNNVGSAGSFVVNGGALGTPSSGTVTNLTGTASININGTVGATTPTTGAFTTLSADGNVTISGTSRRILGNFVSSLGDAAERVLFQNSTTDGNTSVGAIPNGTGNLASFSVFNSSTPTNSSRGSIQVNDSVVNIVAGAQGSGTQLPMTLSTTGIERARITTDGYFGIGTSSPATQLQVSSNTDIANGTLLQVQTTGGTNDPVISIENYNGGSPVRYGISCDDSGRLVFLSGAYTGAAGTGRMYITSGGEVYIAGTTDRGAFNLQCNGTGVWGQGAYTNGSDARMKEDISPIVSGMDVVAKLNPVQFRYKKELSKDTELQPGFIAQDLQVALDGKEYLNGVVKAGPEFLSVAYQTLIPILVKAIQELKAEIDMLKGK